MIMKNDTWQLKSQKNRLRVFTIELSSPSLQFEVNQIPGSLVRLQKKSVHMYILTPITLLACMYE